jgi:hypothetical protein
MQTYIAGFNQSSSPNNHIYAYSQGQLEVVVPLPKIIVEIGTGTVAPKEQLVYLTTRDDDVDSGVGFIAIDLKTKTVVVNVGLDDLVQMYVILPNLCGI